MIGKSIADERPTLTEILEKRDILLELKEAINQRLVHCSEEEWLRVETLPVTGSSFPVTRAGSEGRRNTCAQFTRWSLKA